MKEQQDFIKRWFLMMASGPLMYFPGISNATAKAKTDPDYRKWTSYPYPLASATSHGQRMIIIGKSIDTKQLYNLPLSGDPHEKPIIDHSRSFASHGVKLNKDYKIEEEKLFAGAKMH